MERELKTWDILRAAGSLDTLGLSLRDQRVIEKAQLQRIAQNAGIVALLTLMGIPVLMAAYVSLYGLGASRWFIAWSCASGLLILGWGYAVHRFVRVRIDDDDDSMRRSRKWLFALTLPIAANTGLVFAAYDATFDGSQTQMASLALFGTLIVGSVCGLLLIFATVPTLAMSVIMLMTLPFLGKLALNVPLIGGYIVLMATLTYVATAALIVLYFRSFLEQNLSTIEQQRQGRDIALLLGDFEAQASDWLWESDAEGMLTYVPRRMIAASRGIVELQGNIADLPEMPWRETVSSALLEGAPFRGIEFPLLTPNGRRWWSLSGTRTETGWRGVGSDITVRHAQLAALEDAKAEAEAALRSKEAFIAAMSHEVRTPLNAIIGYAGLLERGQLGEIKDQTALDCLAEIRTHGQELDEHFSKIIEFANIATSPNLQDADPVPAYEVVSEAISTKRRQAREREITIGLEGDRNLELRSNRDHLVSILGHLLDNAIRFSDRGQSVAVQFERRDSNIAITITDNGIGMTEEELERALAPFGQVEQGLTRRHRGVGLGLTLAEAKARLLNGRLHIRSGKGAGTSVTVEVPSERRERRQLRSRGRPAA